MNKLLIISLIVITFLVAIVIETLYYSQLISIFYAQLIFSLLALYFAMVFFLIKTTKDKKVFKELVEQQDEYRKNINGFITVLRTERHDFMNHFAVLGRLLSMGKADMADIYLKEVLDKTSINSQVMVLKQPVLIALLNGKISQASSKGIKFILKIGSSLADLSINSTDITAIFGNLIDNAMDAVSGEARKYAAFISIHTREDPEAYIISVGNSGPSIQDNILSKIFETGFSTKGDGRGFGLSIVLSTVERYGGNVTISSEPTTFTVVIPREKKENDSRNVR